MLQTNASIMQNGRFQLPNAAHGLQSGRLQLPMLQIACGKATSNNKTLQIACKMQMACKMEVSSSQMLQIACGKASSNYKMLQIACKMQMAYKMEGFSSQMLRIACGQATSNYKLLQIAYKLVKGSSSKMLQMACKQKTFQTIIQKPSGFSISLCLSSCSFIFPGDTLFSDNHVGSLENAVGQKRWHCMALWGRKPFMLMAMVSNTFLRAMSTSMQTSIVAQFLAARLGGSKDPVLIHVRTEIPWWKTTMIDMAWYDYGMLWVNTLIYL